MTDQYSSILGISFGEYKEKGSKFLAYAFPVSNEEEIKQQLRSLKEKYWDASHHCYAYILGPKSEVYRANDAGEPNHSAGDTILSQIRSFNLTNTLVVVIRYFGGTKLGVSGLITAYKAAAKEALITAKVVELFVMNQLEIKFGFNQTSLVMKNIKSFECEVVDQTFDNSTLQNIVVVKIRQSLESKFTHNLQSTLGIEITSNL